MYICSNGHDKAKCTCYRLKSQGRKGILLWRDILFPPRKNHLRSIMYNMSELFDRPCLRRGNSLRYVLRCPPFFEVVRLAGPFDAETFLNNSSGRGTFGAAVARRNKHASSCFTFVVDRAFFSSLSPRAPRPTAKSHQELVLEFPVKSSGQHFRAVNSADAAVAQ